MFIDLEGDNHEDGRLNPQIHLKKVQSSGFLYIMGRGKWEGLLL